MRPLLAATLLCALAPAAYAADSQPAAGEAQLTVTIQGVLPQPSQLRVGVFDAATYDNPPPAIRQVVDAASPETVVVFDHLVPGRIAVKVHQDLDGDGEMDTTLIGVPEEPFGLSNNVKPGMSAPGFDETGFDLKPGPNAITIVMQEM